MGDIVEVKRRGRVAVVTLNAPEKRNAISSEMRLKLREVLQTLNIDETCGAIVLTGANGFFCAGADVSQMVSPTDDPIGAITRLNVLHDVVRILVGGRKPAVAAVEGAAAGAGLSLAAACDIILAAEDARFIPSFLGVGLTADCGLQWTMGARIGPAATRRLLLASRPVPAADAKAMGMVDRLVPAGETLEEAIGEAEKMAALAPLAVAAVKKAFAQTPLTLEDALSRESDIQVPLAMSADHVEAKAAFKERRPARFIGR